MSFSDETLAAYVDGELKGEDCAEIEKALRSDPSVERRIARYRALRSRLQAAYAPELDEPVPDRLLAALRDAAPRSSSAVADLETARAAISKKAPRRTAAAAARRYALAASVLIAVGAGFLAWRHSREPSMETVNGTLVARGSLDTDLSERLSGAVGRQVQIGLSFVAKSGTYCRTFTLSDDAGLACRRGGRWEIQALAKGAESPPGAGSGFRTAGSAMPTKILEVIEQQMAGEPLDRAGEIAARDGHWSGTAQR